MKHQPMRLRLGFRQWQILSLLAARPDPMAMAEVHERLGLSQSQLSKLSRCLHDRGLIRRWRDEAGNRRCAWLEITPSGRTLADRVRATCDPSSLVQQETTTCESRSI
jgi:DNA-binding MarR family transcriptional regulator